MQQIPRSKASNLTRHRSDIFDAAIRSPVAISKHREPKFVLMSVDQHRHLNCGVTWQVHVPEEMTDCLKTLMNEGLEQDLQPDDD